MSEREGGPLYGVTKDTAVLTITVILALLLLVPLRSQKGMSSSATVFSTVPVAGTSSGAAPGTCSTPSSSLAASSMLMMRPPRPAWFSIDAGVVTVHVHADTSWPSFSE